MDRSLEVGFWCVRPVPRASSVRKDFRRAQCASPGAAAVTWKFKKVELLTKIEWNKCVQCHTLTSGALQLCQAPDVAKPPAVPNS